MTLEPASPPPLSSLYIYLTHECNQSCPHCWINPEVVGRYRGERPHIDEYRRFIDASLPLGLEFVKLTGGEPLLRPEVQPIIEHASAAGVETMIETNAMLVTPEHADFFRTHEVGLSVSLDGATAAVHDRRRGHEGAFERTYRALELITEADVPLVIVTAVSRSNLEEIPKVLELVRDLKKRRSITVKINPVVPMGRARKMAHRGETLSPRELLALAETVTDELVPEYRRHGITVALQLELAFFSIESLASGRAKAGVGHCGFLTLISLLADGGITFCGVGYTQPDLVMGNIRGSYDLPALWEGHPRLREMRRKVRDGLEGACRDCLFQPVCLGGCRALAMTAGESDTAAPVWCQALYDEGLFPPSRLRASTTGFSTASRFGQGDVLTPS